MQHCNDFIVSFMERYHYPEIAVKEFTRIEKRLDEEKDFGDRFDAILNGYMFPEADGLGQALDEVKKLGEEYGENEYTIQFMLILNCMPILKERYDAAGIDEKIFWDSADDLRCKLLECIKCKEVPGTFVAGWNDGFLKMDRFAYGRFQYEVRKYDFDFDFITRTGHRVRRGDTLINFHIPSSGVPLTDEVRLSSYKEAYKHFVHLFPDGKVIFCCGSWLLYPKHREFLPENSNILKFMSDFEIVSWSEYDHFSNDWRVFDKYAGLPYDQLPRDTSLRRAYADWLVKTGKGGDAFGVIVFDGEKICR